MNYPPVHPRPVMSIISLSIPLCDLQTEKSEVEVSTTYTQMYMYMYVFTSFTPPYHFLATSILLAPPISKWWLCAISPTLFISFLSLAIQPYINFVRRKNTTIFNQLDKKKEKEKKNVVWWAGVWKQPVIQDIVR